MSEQKDEHIELLREIAKWLRFMGLEKAKTVLASALDNNEKKTLAYHLSDGKNTSTIIAGFTGVSQSRISEWWKEWLSVGLGESVSASGGGRFKRSFDLKMFGIVVPEIKQTTSSEQKTETQQTTEGETK